MPTRKNARTTRTAARRAVGYVRISVNRQDETSTETQEERIRAHCAGQGMEVVDVVGELGRSAYKASRSARPGMARAMAVVEAGAADAFVVWKLDRAARNVRDLLDLVHDLERHGVAFVSVTEGFDTSTAVGRMTMTILAAVAEMESATKGERIDAWHDHRKANGATPTGRRPYGYRRSRNRLEIDDAEAAVIRRAAAAILEGRSLRSIHRELVDEGVTRNGKPLNERSLRFILVGPTIAALREIDDGVFVPSDQWPAIVDRETWDAVREVLLDPGRRVGPGPARRWLLSGIATCGRDGCGAPLGIKTNGRAGPRYFCRACGLSIDAPKTDYVIERAVLALLDDRTWRRLRRRGSPRVDTSALEAELVELAQQRADGDLGAEEWSILRHGIVRRLEDAAAEPVPLPSIENVRATWKAGDLSLDERRLILSAVVVRLAVLPARGGPPRFDVDRIELDLIAA